MLLKCALLNSEPRIEMPHSGSPISYSFDQFELQPEERRLLVGGAPVALGAKSFELLLAFVERAGELVTREELMQRAWPAQAMDENNLRVQISGLRKLLGQDAIDAVFGKGYRFTRQLMAKPATAIARARAQSTENNNLPCNLDILIGRERELVELQTLLAGHQLVTVTGPGGVGKTRLMIASAQSLLERYEAGVWLVELAAQGDPERMTATVASALRIEIKDSASASETIIRQLRDKQMLLLFDNCEHLVDAVASFLNALLAAAPKVQVVTSSQEILGVAAEQVYRVPSLTLPETVTPSAAEAQASGAVGLFVERAREADLGFECTDLNAATVSSICRRLDGIPLAIEMAAARVSTLGLDSLAQLLDERFHVLAGGRRGAIPRQRTLQATLDWSYGLLAQRERVVFRRLAGFVGGFTLAAAIGVAADDELDQFQVIDCVTNLVSKSLLVVDTGGGHARYRLLETTRAYALERLAEANEATLVARLAAQHYQLVFKSCFDDWTRLPDNAFDARYSPDLDNLRLALDWCFGPGGDVQLGIALTGLSGPLWIGRLMISEAQQRLDTALAALGPDTPPEIEADLQLVAGMFFYWRLNERAVAAINRAISLYRSPGDTPRLCLGQLLLGSSLVLASVEGGEELLLQARAALAGSERPRLLAMVPKCFGLMHTMRGMNTEAMHEFSSALALSRVAGDEILELTVLENMANVLWIAGDLPSALAAARAVLERCKQVKIAHRVGWGWIYGNLFGILTESGELAEACAVGRLAMPYLVEASAVWIMMDHYALRMAKVGSAEDAARVFGWINEVYAQKDRPRQPTEHRANQNTLALLRERLSPDQLARLCADGARMSEKEACRLSVL